MVYPKKHLGQHFLTDSAIAERIVNLLPNEEKRIVMEIGPGKGVLTDFLIKQDLQKLLLVEIDGEAVAYLNDRFPYLRDSILQQDFLRMSDEYFDYDKMHIIGNFPYNISSQIFFKVLDHRQQVSSVTCMIQKEVAERIASPPGSKVYGILSVLLQAFYTIENQFSVKPGSFFPPPKVTSSVITLKRNETKQLTCDEKLFRRVVKATFNHRRKTIRNSLKSILLNLGNEFEMLSERPEQLGVAEFVELTNWVEVRLAEEQS